MTLTFRALVDALSVAETVALWLTEEWPDGLSVSARKVRLLAPDDCPPALFASFGDVAAGVLAFRRFARNGEEKPSLFIDALYVHISFRRSGIGTALLAAGVAAAAAMERRLFVYTSLPNWYVSRGWAILEKGPEPGCFVLDRSLR